MTNRVELLFSPPTQLLDKTAQPRMANRKNNLLEILMLIPLVILFLQGIFEPVVSDWITSEGSFLSGFLPFKLYPLDLLAFPLMIFVGLFALNSQLNEIGGRKGKLLAIWISLCSFSLALLLGRSVLAFELIPGVHFTDLLILPIGLCLLAVWYEQRAISIRSKRIYLLILWWTAISIGIVIGLSNDTPDLTGDIRKYLLRPLLAVAAFYIGLQIDFEHFFRWLVRLSLLTAILVAITSLAYFAGFSWPFSQEISRLYGGLGLLFGYAWLLVQVLGGNPKLNNWFALALIAFAMLTTLAKPLIAAFLIITLLALLVTTLGRGQNKLLRYLILGVFLAMLGVVLYWLLFLEGTAGSYVATRYLKEGMAVQDLSGGRFSIWRLGWQKWLEKPLLGQGSGYLLSGEIVELGSGVRSQRDVLLAHNIVMQFLYQLGLVGFLLISLTILLWAVTAAKVLVSARVDMPETSYHKTTVVVVGTVLIMSLYGSYVDNSISAFLLWTALGFEAALAIRIARQ